MLRKRKVFVTIEFAHIQGAFDYPKNLPIPGLNEEVHFNNKFGKVLKVVHSTHNSVTDIRITCT